MKKRIIVGKEKNEGRITVSVTADDSDLRMTVGWVHAYVWQNKIDKVKKRICPIHSGYQDFCDKEPGFYAQALEVLEKEKIRAEKEVVGLKGKAITNWSENVEFERDES